MFLTRHVSPHMTFIHKSWCFVTPCWCFSKLGIFRIIVTFVKKLEDVFYSNSLSSGEVVREGPGDRLKTVIWIFSWVKKNILGKNRKNNKQAKNTPCDLYFLSALSSHRVINFFFFFFFFLDKKMPAFRAIFIDLKMDIFFLPSFPSPNFFFFLILLELWS